MPISSSLRRRLPPGFFDAADAGGAFDPAYGPDLSPGGDNPMLFMRGTPPAAPSFGPTPAPALPDAFSPARQPSLEGTQEYQDYLGAGARLRAALTPPKPISTPRALLAAFVGTRSPMLGSVITGDYQRQHMIQPLAQQYEIASDTIKQNQAMENAAAMNRYHRALAGWAEYRPELEQSKLDTTELEKRNTVNQQLYGKGLEGEWDENNRLIGVKQLPFEMIPGARKYIPDVDPRTGQRFYRIAVRGQEVGRMEVNEIPAFMQKESQTSQFMTDINGNIVQIPKATVTSPMFGGAPLGPGPTPTGPATPSLPTNITGFGSAGTSGGRSAMLSFGGTGAGQGTVPATAATPRAAAVPRAAAAGPRVITQAKAPKLMLGTMPNGTQVAGSPKELLDSGVEQSNITEMPETIRGQVIQARLLTAPNGLFANANKALAKFKPGELEGLSPRWQEFLAGTYGTADPRYIDLRTQVNGLLNTALMQAHVGATGRVAMMEKFQSLADTGKMSKETLKAALDSERKYVEERAMRPQSKRPAVAPSGAGTVPTFSEFSGIH